MAGINVEIDDRIESDISEERVKVTIDDTPIKIGSDIRDVVRVSDKFKVSPNYYSGTYTYTMPDSALDYVSQSELESSILGAVGDSKVYVDSQMQYDVTGANGTIMQKLNEIDVDYISTGEIGQYALIAELSQLTIAEDFYIDRWNNDYIQDRDPWTGNDAYLALRGAAIDVTAAEANYPLSGLTGTLQFEADGTTPIIRSHTQITAQHIYDQSVRVGNSMATYYEDIITLADDQGASSGVVTTLTASVGDMDVRLQTEEAVSVGTHVWDGIETLLIGMKRVISGMQETYFGAIIGWKQTTADTAKSWAGGASSFVTDPINGYITGWNYAASSTGDSEFIIAADVFKIANSSNPSLAPFTVTANKINMTADVEVGGSLITGVIQQTNYDPLDNTKNSTWDLSTGEFVTHNSDGSFVLDSIAGTITGAAISGGTIQDTSLGMFVAVQKQVKIDKDVNYIGSSSYAATEYTYDIVTAPAGQLLTVTVNYKVNTETTYKQLPGFNTFPFWNLIHNGTTYQIKFRWVNVDNQLTGTDTADFVEKVYVNAIFSSDDLGGW